MSKARKVKPPPPKPEPVGLECPGCGCRHFYTIYTRTHVGRIVRRRECRYCGRRVTTAERVTG